MRKTEERALDIELKRERGKERAQERGPAIQRVVGGLLDFSVRPSPNWTLDFNCFGFGIGIRSKDTGLGTGA